MPYLRAFLPCVLKLMPRKSKMCPVSLSKNCAQIRKTNKQTKIRIQHHAKFEALASTHSPNKTWKPQYWPGSTSHNYAKIGTINRTWPQTNLKTILEIKLNSILNVKSAVAVTSRLAYTIVESPWRHICKHGFSAIVIYKRSSEEAGILLFWDNICSSTYRAWGLYESLLVAGISTVNHTLKMLREYWLGYLREACIAAYS